MRVDVELESGKLLALGQPCIFSPQVVAAVGPMRPIGTDKRPALTTSVGMRATPPDRYDALVAVIGSIVENLAIAEDPLVFMNTFMRHHPGVEPKL